MCGRTHFLFFAALSLAACSGPPAGQPPTVPTPPDPIAGQGDCRPDGTWAFGDPADPANHARFLQHATAQQYVPVSQGGVRRALPVVPPAPGGGLGTPIPGAVSGTIEPRAGINGSARSAYENSAGRSCPGRVIARVTIDGRSSPNDSIRRDAQRALQARRDAAQGEILHDSLALLGGYKTLVHRHGVYHPDPGLEHRHRYFPEGTSYVWMDQLTDLGNGVTLARGVIVSEDTSVSPWIVRIRYCGHSQPSGGPTDPNCAPAHPVPHPPPLARWLDIPEDDHAWEWCASRGCCIVESSTFEVS